MTSPSQHYKSLIKARIKTLQQSQQQTDRASQTVELDQSQVGRLSRMDALQMQQMELELGRRQSRELKALENALTRIRPLLRVRRTDQPQTPSNRPHRHPLREMR